MLGQRRRRWPNIGTTLGRCLVFLGNPLLNQKAIRDADALILLLLHKKRRSNQAAIPEADEHLMSPENGTPSKWEFNLKSLDHSAWLPTRAPCAVFLFVSRSLSFVLINCRVAGRRPRLSFPPWTN